MLGGLLSYGPNLPDLHRRAADASSRAYAMSFGWAGLGAPRNTPSEIIDRLNKEMAPTPT